MENTVLLFHILKFEIAINNPKAPYTYSTVISHQSLRTLNFLSQPRPNIVNSSHGTALSGKKLQQNPYPPSPPDPIRY